MYSTNIKKEDQDVLFTVENTFFISFMSQLKPLFKDVFLCKMDKDVIPVPMVYETAMDTADQIKSSEILKAKEFIKIISIDDYGNLREIFFLNYNEHDIHTIQSTKL